MSPALAPLIAATSISADLMLAGVVVLCVSAAVGFVSGMFYERSAARRALSRASRHLSQLVNVVVDSLRAAQAACDALENHPHLVLSARQLQQLDATQSTLLETVNRVVVSQQSLAEAVARQDRPQPEPVEFELAWQCETEAAGGLPDRSLFEANLQLLLEAGEAAGVDSGLLFIKIDKFDQLQSRCGAGGAAALVRKLAAVVSRAGRDEDLLCRYSSDTLALLMPRVDGIAARQLAQKIRDSVRGYQFRLDESGPEVFVTASYGLTICEAADNLDLVVNRAGNAVARSERRGRNQLHMQNGELPVNCLAGQLTG